METGQLVRVDFDFLLPVLAAHIQARYAAVPFFVPLRNHAFVIHRGQVIGDNKDIAVLVTSRKMIHLPSILIQLCRNVEERHVHKVG